METDTPQPFLEHLDDLRRRIWIVLGFLIAFSAAGYAFVDRIIALLARPTGGFVFTRLTEAFLARLEIALVSGCFLTIPVLLYEVWRFMGVALTPKERRVTLKILPFSYLLFTAGAACAWFVVLPAATRFLLGFATSDLRPLVSIDAYVGFVAWFMAAFGLLFQLPLAVLFLVKTGFTTPRALAACRRHVIVGLAIISAVLTPGPDIFSLLALLIPTYLLYEASIWISRWYV
ncbi:MAG: twin arginine-targeting protein translocase TatC [Elusimicrobia bacterium RIFCSPLOWO2_01_FULL_59_12]|nr:MAG: twin arginine-targeting protein translocase TatC [Elusimicrobia bacterium RIFCSPLOWO2_01_FULL_59_12]